MSTLSPDTLKVGSSVKIHDLRDRQIILETQGADLPAKGMFTFPDFGDVLIESRPSLPLGTYLITEIRKSSDLSH